MRLQAYLRIGPTRPKWAYLADDLLAKNIPGKHRVDDAGAALNMFLQTWDATTRANRSRAPWIIRQILKSAKEYNVTFALKDLSDPLKREMPIWHHLGFGGADSFRQNSTHAACLRSTHEILSPQEACKKRRKRKPYVPKKRPPTPKKRCACEDCTVQRETGCNDPEGCRVTATKIMGKLPAQWKPSPENQAQRDCEYPPNEIYDNSQGKEFERDKPTQTSLAECFRVFTAKNQSFEETHANLPPPDAPPSRTTVVVYTDGSCFDNGSDEAKAGAGAWFGDDDPRNIAARVPPNVAQSNNSGEIMAILLATRETPCEVDLIIKSDSQVAIDALTIRRRLLEDSGWIGFENRALLEPLIYELAQRTGRTKLVKVKGHSGEKG
ncbi:ribonuclease H-like domain-containing protein [Coprinopsis sp. MPI-PUGE-AT-0042]|nr:ribonuclease H-like domain-containing protein [Coprinopsis sp. MPI-PUGE-AT-0042]